MVKRERVAKRPARFESHAELLPARSEDRFDLRVALKLLDHSLHFVANGILPK
ncbi:hypothetical protein [Sphingomonas hengshuiensis]|uniref:hypothetical protein n=1 Tax=Sphingomonas hengshuiensis TaxID=1609977 RepID=UPI0012B9666B|nr:hypothetical protein [Sphingomonas hengshuiensis]